MDLDSDEAGLPTVSVPASVVHTPESNDSKERGLDVAQDVVNVITPISAQSVFSERNYALGADLVAAGAPTRRPLSRCKRCPQCQEKNDSGACHNRGEAKYLGCRKL